MIHSFLQMMTIFQAIIIEALPFVIFGCIVSSLLHFLISPEKIKKIIPSNKIVAILLGSLSGMCFPSCECGIIPIIRELLEKEIPDYVSIPFMLTAPIINPVVMFSTYVAFGNSFYFPILRAVGCISVAFFVGIWLAYFNKYPVLKDNKDEVLHCHGNKGKRFVWSFTEHSINEFFLTSKYLIIGSVMASFMQVYIPTSFMLAINKYQVVSILMMMLLAFMLSLCSEADAFVGSSLLSIFGRGPVVAFLLIGPMVDIKNLLMMKNNLEGKFYIRLVVLIILCVSVYSCFI